MKRSFKLLYKFIVVGACLLLAATESLVIAAERIGAEQWQNLTDDKAFSYRTQQETWKAAKQQDNLLNTIIGLVFAFFSSTAGRAIIWILFFVFVGWVLYKLFFGGQFFLSERKKMKDDVIPSQDADTDIMAIDWESLLRQATTESNIPLAIRYSYMHLLQLLQQKQLINYSREKTNNQYYKELGDASLKAPFRQLASQYEYVYYGSYPLSARQYDSYMNTFQILKNKVSG